MRPILCESRWINLPIDMEMKRKMLEKTDAPAINKKVARK
jgi:hypothetical protein